MRGRGKILPCYYNRTPAISHKSVSRRNERYTMAARPNKLVEQHTVARRGSLLIFIKRFATEIKEKMIDGSNRMLINAIGPRLRENVQRLVTLRCIGAILLLAGNA